MSIQTKMNPAIFAGALHSMQGADCFVEALASKQIVVGNCQSFINLVPGNQLKPNCPDQRVKTGQKPDNFSCFLAVFPPKMRSDGVRMPLMSCPKIRDCSGKLAKNFYVEINQPGENIRDTVTVQSVIERVDMPNYDCSALALPELGDEQIHVRIQHALLPNFSALSPNWETAFQTKVEPHIKDQIIIAILPNGQIFQKLIIEPQSYYVNGQKRITGAVNHEKKVQASENEENKAPFVLISVPIKGLKQDQSKTVIGKTEERPLVIKETSSDSGSDDPVGCIRRNKQFPITVTVSHFSFVSDSLQNLEQMELKRLAEEIFQTMQTSYELRGSC